MNIKNVGGLKPGSLSAKARTSGILYNDQQMAPAYSGAERRGILIRNIVFDMGKVLVDYSGMPVCRHFTDNEALAKRICTAVFDSRNGFF